MAGVAVVVLGGVVAVLLAAGTGRSGGGAAGPPRQDAGSFMAGVVRLIGENRYGDAWKLLHPVDRRAAGLEEYMVCELRSPVPGRVRSVRVEGVRPEPALLAPGHRVESTAVDVRIEIAGGPSSGRVVVADTVHAVSVNGSWTWILPSERLAQYRADRCPSAAAPPVPPQGA